MNRRPWPIVLLAILQFLTPVIYLGFAAGFYGISFLSAAREVYELTSPLRRLEIFALPILLGVLIFMTKRVGYFIAMIGCAYGIARGITEFIASNQTDPVFPIILSNIFCIAAIAYLARPKARSVYFNPRLRWWETEARYMVGWPASVTRVGAAPMKATIQNIAGGGAGVETLEAAFLKGEVVVLEFQHEGTIYRLNSKIAWEKPGSAPKQFIGVQWDVSNPNAERSKVRRLIRALKSAKTITTRQAPPIVGGLKGKKD